MIEHLDTVVIGAGQAGLSIGYYLSKLDREYVILEKASTITPTWRKRWDSFTLVLPNWTYQIPDHAYNGDDPNGFMVRDDLVEHLEQFAASFDPEIRFGSKVTSVNKNPNGDNFLVTTTESTILADKLSWLQERSKNLEFHLSARIFQMSSPRFIQTIIAIRNLYQMVRCS
jgi:putative flavoprotein involved in K+ transport